MEMGVTALDELVEDLHSDLHLTTKESHDSRVS